MQNDLISRQRAIEKILGQPPEAHYPSWYARQIEDLPPAQPKREVTRNYPTPMQELLEVTANRDYWEAQCHVYEQELERIKGHWIVKHGSDAPPICDKCGYESRTTIKEVVDQNLKMIYCTGIDIKSNFCPNCGADMREVTE